jgi:hypothetical protein
MSPRNIVTAKEPTRPPATEPAMRPPATEQAMRPPATKPAMRPVTGPNEFPARPEQDDLKALGRQALDRADQAPDVAEVPAPAPQPAGDEAEARQEEASFDLGRMAWLVTVLSCLLAVTILVLDGYLGYAGVTLAVALAAAINLL